MSDLISRQAAIDVLGVFTQADALGHTPKQIVEALPSAHPERRFDEWCTDCKEYDNERHCCPRFNHVIRTTLQDAQRTGRWIGRELGHCSCCGHEGCASDIWDGCKDGMFCPNCGASMEEQE